MIPGLLDELPVAPMELEREQSFARALAEPAGGERRRRLMEKLTLHSMREAFLYARRCCRGKLPDGEIYSLAYAALSRAATTFKPDNIRFFAYSKVFIRGEVSRVWKTRDVIKRVSKESMIPMTDQRYEIVYESVDNAVVGDHILRPASPTMRRDTLDQSVEPEFDAMHAREIWETLEPLVEEKLSPKERKVIFLRYKNGLTFQEIGTKLGGMLRSTAQAIHVRALRKLRSALERTKKIL